MFRLVRCRLALFIDLLWVSNVSATARFLDMGRTSPLKDASDRTDPERMVTTAQFSSQQAGL